MFENDATEFDPTEFDPNPWGARQRLIPRATFIAVPPQAHQAPPCDAPPIRPACEAPPFFVAHTAPPAASSHAAPPATGCEAPPFVVAHARHHSLHPAPPATVAYAVPRVAIEHAPPRATMRVPALPLHPRSRSLARYAVPVFGLVTVLCLALAYAMKPATIAPTKAASIAMPAGAEPLALSSSGIVSETAPAEVAVVAKAAPKPRSAAKRRPIKIDASITSSPLGQLRPSRR